MHPRSEHSGGGLPYRWGATDAEVADRYPCDALAAPRARRVLRAGDSPATTPVLFEWLKQLRVASYSYDLLDNFGRSSPRNRTLGDQPLEVGQLFMKIFELVDFEEGSCLSLRIRPGRTQRFYGPLVLTYRVRPTSTGSRLVCVMHVPYQGLAFFSATMWTFLWGDLLMMRKQFRTLSELAARENVRH